MAKKKSNPESLIALELDRLSNKVDEFQDYLEAKQIRAEADDNARQKEIEVQIKMVNALFEWLPSLEALRSLGMNEEEKEEYRKGTRPAGIASKK